MFNGNDKEFDRLMFEYMESDNGRKHHKCGNDGVNEKRCKSCKYFKNGCWLDVNNPMSKTCSDYVKRKKK